MIKTLEHVLYAATMLPLAIGWFWDYWNWYFYYEFSVMLAVMGLISFAFGKTVDFWRAHHE